MENELINDINQSLEISLAPAISTEELRRQLATHINDLINHDFEKLVYYLYRIDVHEDKMRQVLDKRQDQDAGELIADLIIERQLQKIESRKLFGKKSNSEDEDGW